MKFERQCCCLLCTLFLELDTEVKRLVNIYFRVQCCLKLKKDIRRKELIRCFRPYIFGEKLNLNIFEIFLLGADPEKWLPSGEAKLKSLVYNFLVSFIIVLLPTLT